MDYKDNYGMKTRVKGHLQMKLFKGDYDFKNDKITGEILETFDDHNVIVNTASDLIASLIVASGIKRVKTGEEGAIIQDGQLVGYDYNGTFAIDEDTYPVQGISCLALGNGLLESFNTTAQQGEYIMTADTTMLITEQEKLKKLQNEIFRKGIDYWCFLSEDNNGMISETATNVIRLTTLIEYDRLLEVFAGKDTPMYIVEMGLFGGPNCITETSVKDENDNTVLGKDTGIMFNYRLFKGWNMIENSQLLVHWTLTF